MIGALKKLNLYSEKHSVYRTALGILKKNFDEHFDRFGNFRIHIERSKIVYQDEVLYEGGVEPTDLVSLLHRDGILWLEFQQGLGIWEIDSFYMILRDHSILEEDPEDDIVTALWAVNLPSIMYEAVDLELGLPDDIDFATLPCHGHQIADAEQKDREPIQCQTIYSAMANNVFNREGQDELWELTVAERDQLRKMISAEEQPDGSDYAIDVLLHILENQCLQEDIAELLDILMQELNTALIHARFAHLFEAATRQSLSTLVRHRSAMVRLAALKALMTRDDQAIDDIFALIDDANEKVRKLVLHRLGRERCEQIESKILEYLDICGDGSRSGGQFIAVCGALGNCGSERSIPYLTGLLFKWPTIGVLRPGNSYQRRGAVVALEALQAEKAAWLMDRNDRGFLANIFRSARPQSA